MQIFTTRNNPSESEYCVCTAFTLQCTLFAYWLQHRESARSWETNTTDIRIDATFDHFQLGFHFDDDDKHLHACGHFSFFCIRSIEWNLRISDSSTETHFSITTAQHIRNQNCFGFKLNERKTKRTKKRIWLWRLTAMRLNESKTQPTQLDSARIQNRVSNK